MATWRNWSGSVAAEPSRIERPRDEAELAQIVDEAVGVRAVGAGHSFTPLCETDGVLVSLERMEGDLEVLPDRASVWAPAGWSLKRLGLALWAQGLSLVNQGDIDAQSLAGALATGTHGSGADLGSLSTAALAFRLVMADGAIVACSAEERPELFQAARLGLGLLGVVTRVRLAVLPAYGLSERIRALPLNETIGGFAQLLTEHRHAEFFVFPHADRALVKTLDPMPPGPAPERTSDMDEKGFRTVCDFCAAAPVLTPLLQRMLTPKRLDARRQGPANVIFAAERTVRFEEMEYEIPREAGLAALMEALSRIRRRGLPVAFPLEVRAVAADDIWLSPFHAGPCISVSLHQYAKMPWRPIFDEIEPIFRAHGGRPHWGKRHRLTAELVDRLYPMAARFRAVRRMADPEGKLLNPHLSALFADADAPALS